MTPEELIGEYICPGCTNGHKPDACVAYNPYHDWGYMCLAHCPGTTITPHVGRIILGLPKGFCRLGENKKYVRVWQQDTAPQWDHLNVPVWAMEKDGFLFVHTSCPRINQVNIDVIEGGTLSLVPEAIDVSKFYDEID